jgi:hypothetical protein
MNAKTGKFDLNMEDVLEAWGPADGARELIANALDEHALTDTQEPDIYQDDEGRWHIRDFGRGLRYDHFTQAENEEKLERPDTVIGKFGVGLKDALATFHRHGINVVIHSKHNTFRTEEAPKHGFEDISTLHVDVQPPEQSLEGTDVILDGKSTDAIEEAKGNFIRYSDVEQLEATRFGNVYRVADGESAAVYVTGLKVAEEENFLFSYDITNTTKQIRDALNRERSNVGRTAYTARVKRILRACESETVAERLVDDLQRFTEGSTHDELGWKPIQLHAVQILNARRKVVVSTVDEQRRNRDLLDHARDDGYDVVTVPDRIRDELSSTDDIDGNTIRDVSVYQNEYEDSFEFTWVTEGELREHEQQIWDLRQDLFEIVSHPAGYEFRIAQQFRATDDDSTQGLHQGRDQRIIVHRDVLTDASTFLGVLLHELAHTRTPFPDQTREFENALTDLLGEVGQVAVHKQ